jgi:N-acetylmuramoyl-L-alanine amidase
LQTVEGYSYVRVTDLQPFFEFQIHAVGSQTLSLNIGQHNVILSVNRTLVSLDERLVSLSQPAFAAQGIWYVPLDFIPKVLKLVSGKHFLWLPNNRSLILGDIQPNQITLKYSKEVDHSRLVLQSVRPVNYTIVRQQDSLLIIPQEEDIAPGFPDAQFQDGLLAGLTIQSVGEKKTFRLAVTKEFGSFKTLEMSDPPRFVIDVFRKKSGGETAPAVPTVPKQEVAPPTLLPSTVPEKRVIVIDPGHGGTETGAKGPNGSFEKDIVMSIARKLKAVLESNTGSRVILTRDGDRIVTLDDRTALANNNKADLFISIHANATVRGYAKGAETYFLSVQATDDEARNIAAVENNAVGLNQEVDTMNEDLKLILWDMAQTEYLAESSQLAEMIQQELNSVLGISNRGIKQAPFRVLMGATMPAVLVEVGFINNPSEEKLMKDSEYQLKIATAIFRSIQKFQSSRNQQASHLQTGTN